MSTHMLLRRNEIAKLMVLCDQFDVDLVEVIYNDGGGIGYTMDVVIPTNLHGMDGEFKIEITGTENW